MPETQRAKLQKECFSDIASPIFFTNHSATNHQAYQAVEKPRVCYRFVHGHAGEPTVDLNVLHPKIGALTLENIF